MARADYLELRAGMTQWGWWLHALASGLGVLAILISPAGWIWKFVLICLLACAAILTTKRVKDRRTTGRVRVFRDGTTLFFADSNNRIFGTLTRNQWVSRWLCSLAVHPAKQNGKQFFVIFASANYPDEYRRLLVFLQMRTPSSQAQRMIW